MSSFIFTDNYQVAVVEKFGYGYSDVSGLPRDVATLVEEDRKALKAAVPDSYTRSNMTSITFATAMTFELFTDQIGLRS